ncbi:MAG: type IV pilus biogenesis/stability protein PilW [Gammaproteobacteria bacterium]|nr:type IV pilus biogenesis/stability protein PilW [Gammaproteobacteria bacterium]
MKVSETVMIGLLMAVPVSGCVSSTSGPEERVADTSEAADLNYQLGARYYRNGNYELARDRLLYSIELDPRNAIAHSTLGLTYEQLDNIRLATASYEQAVRVAPNDFEVLNTYAVFLCRQKSYDDAIRYFDRAIRIRENDNAEITLTNAGVCMMQKPDLVKAESYFREALEHKSSYGEALVQLCVMKINQQEYLPARAFLQRYLSGNPPSASVLHLGVRIEDALGDERAKKEYEDRILREFPQSAEARRVLESGQG